ncbi:ribbon-helix-helix protein, CopG family [Candidatus Berkelbacteria bacterium]|nr:ribbon-helix-helix protein, CopG family [Candidatus Berkelbacteria bacterium]
MTVKTTNISLPKELLEKIDQRAKREYKSRSELLKEAALIYLRAKNNWEILQEDMSRRAAEMGLKTEGQIEKMVDLERR